MKKKSMDYILGMITGIALMLAVWGCTHNSLSAGASELGSSSWNPMFVKIVEQMQDELTGIPWIIEWYKNLTGWRAVLYGSIVMGVGMFITKRWIFPIFDKLMGWQIRTTSAS